MIERARVPTLAFLFDEHVSRLCLQPVRVTRVDAVHVMEVGLAGADDPAVFRWAQREDRLIVTRNYRDFAPLARALVSRGESFPGVLFFPTSLRHDDVDGHARALLAWLRGIAHTGVKPVANGFGWLSNVTP